MKPIGIQVLKRKRWAFCRCRNCRPHENPSTTLRAKQKRHDRALAAEQTKSSDE